jgi:16S rRNA (cytidine1402-2'-O)-methyltransferase
MPLFVVATPIGHLEDLSPRAARVLREVDLVLAEDTRVTRVLLQHVASRAPQRSCHGHNEEAAATAALRVLESGGSVALVSDAGTPGVSDPGARVVGRIRAAGYEVQPVPGPSAVVAFLSASGLVSDRWQFVGFAPRRPGERTTALQSWVAWPGITVGFESPQRILGLVAALVAVSPSHPLVLARELTKRFETWHHGPASAVLESLREAGEPRGEFVFGLGEAVAVARDSPAPWTEDEQALLAALALSPMSTREASQRLSRLWSRPVREVYQALLEASEGG